MGKLIVEQIVSADGYTQDQDGRIDFFEHERSINDADADQLRLLDTVGAIVLGRRTFQLFEAFWAEMDPAREPVAEPINAIPKYVVSNSLASAPWGRKGDAAQVLRGDGVAAVRDLKHRVDGDLIVWGSLTLADALLKGGAVDILRLRLIPKLIGAGRSIAPSDLGHRKLNLRSVQSYKDGFIVIEYGLP
jgi:dihydrofolate reductase